MSHSATVPHIESVTLVRTQLGGGPGQRLRAAREALGLGLNDIAKRMRLQEHVIHQIEQDMYDENTALVFVKGYLRSYAVLVGLNPDQIIQDFLSIGLTEERDTPDLSKLIKRTDKPRRMSMPLKLQSNPAILWGCVAASAVAIIALLWVYLGDHLKLKRHHAAAAAEQATATPAITGSALPATLTPAPIVTPLTPSAGGISAAKGGTTPSTSMSTGTGTTNSVGGSLTNPATTPAGAANISGAAAGAAAAAPKKATPESEPLF